MYKYNRQVSIIFTGSERTTNPLCWWKTRIPGEWQRLLTSLCVSTGASWAGEGGFVASPTVETGECLILIYEAEQLCVIIP